MEKKSGEKSEEVLNKLIVVFNRLERKIEHRVEYDYRFTIMENKFEPTQNEKYLKEHNMKVDSVAVICIIEVERQKVSSIAHEKLELVVKKSEEEILGVVYTDIINLNKDVEEIALLGSGIVKRDLKILVKNIETAFPRMETRIIGEEGEKKSAVQIETLLNDSIEALKECYNQYSAFKKGKSDKEKNYANIFSIHNGYFCIQVAYFNDFYKDMDISKYMSLRDYKIYLKDAGYSKTNKGRNDYTIVELGKTLALDINKLKNKK